MTGAFILFFSLIEYYGSFKEITWRDFNQNYLTKGNVDRLEVINKKWVKVILKTAEQVKLDFSLQLAVDRFKTHVKC